MTIRVLLLIADTVGGGGRYVRSIVDGLTGADFEFTVGYGSSDGGFEHWAESRAGASERIRFPRGDPAYTDIRQLYELLTETVDVVHYVGTRAGLYGTFGAMIRAPEVNPFSVYSAISVGLNQYPPGRDRKFRSALHRTIADRVDLVVTNADEAEMVSAGIVPQDRITTVYNGVPTPAASPSVAPGASERILFIGRLVEQKDPFTLLRAFARVTSTHPAGRLLIVGDGPLSPQVRRLARDLGIETRVDHLGWRDDLPAVMSKSAVFVLPSRWEGLPYVLLDAMALGLPVVATNVNGMRDAIAHEVNGLLVEPENDEELARNVSRLLEDPTLADRLGRHARRTVAGDFSETAMLARFEEIYRNGVRSRDTSRGAQ